MTEKDIFQYSDPVEYIGQVFEDRKTRNPSYSLRAWAKQMGYENPSYLSQVLKGERKLKPELAAKLGENLKLVEKKKKYFELLVLLQNAKTTSEKSMYVDLIEALRPKYNKLPILNLDLDLFRFVADWYHLAILEMLELKDCDSSPDFFVKKLQNRVSLTQVQKALERLERLQLIRRTPKGLVRAKQNHLLVGKEMPSQAVREYHTQMLELSKDALKTQNTEQRDIRGSVLSIKKTDYKKIQEIIKKAHAEILEYSCEGDGEDIYHFSTQFFKLTGQETP